LSFLARGSGRAGLGSYTLRDSAIAASFDLLQQYFSMAMVE
jgi:hypothetical protein